LTIKAALVHAFNLLSSLRPVHESLYHSNQKDYTDRPIISGQTSPRPEIGLGGVMAWRGMPPR